MFMNYCCHCGTPLPDCIPCTGITGDFDFSKISVDMGTFSWSRSASSTCTGSYAYNASTGSLHEIRMRSRDIANVGGVKDLWRAPAGGTRSRLNNPSDLGPYDGTECLWVWNDSKAVEIVWHDWGGFTDALLDEIAEYTPENVVDPDDPWNQVLPAITDSRCGTTFPDGNGTFGPNGRHQCTTTVYGSGIDLEIRTGPDTGSEWDATGGTRKWWVLKLNVSIYLAGFHGQYIGAFSRLPLHAWFTGVGGVASAAPWSFADGDPPCNTDRLLINGGVLIYAKPVVCDNDFNGDPIVLPKNVVLSERADDMGITYPTSVELTL